MRRLCLAMLLIASLLLIGRLTFAADAGAPALIANGDFQAWADGRPAGWQVTTPGWATAPAPGESPDAPAVRFSRSGAADQAAPYGILLQAIPSEAMAAVAGRRFTLTARVRVLSRERQAEAAMWARVDRSAGRMGFFDNMDGRRIRGENWQEARIDGEVAADAEGLTLGFLAFGDASIEVAAVQLLVLGSALEGSRPPAPLDDRELATVTATGRLHHLVRFFYPSSESVSAPWDALLIAAIDRAASAATPAEVARVLVETYSPIAPLLRVGTDGPDAAAFPVEMPAIPPHTHSVHWVHNGLGPGDPRPGQIYASVRTVLPVGEHAVPAPHRFTLAPGLWAEFPLALPCTAEGQTLPAAQGTLPQPQRPLSWRSTAEDRSVRLASVLVAWNTLHHFYPYFDAITTDWPAAQAAALGAAALAADTIEQTCVLERLMFHLHDGHGHVGHPSVTPGRVLGLRLLWAGDALVAAEPFKSAEGEIRPGDVVLAIDQRPIDAITRELGSRISAATEGWRRHRLLAAIAAEFNQPTSTVRVRTGDGEPREVAVPAFPLDQFTHIQRPVNLPRNGSQVAPGIVYFDLVGADAAAWSQHRSAVAAARGVIFDVRGYPGEAGLQVLRHLVPGPVRTLRMSIPLVTLPDRENFTFNPEVFWNLTPLQPRIAGKVAFLTNAGAISYAESCLSIVRSLGLGEIIGQTTAGTNGNINRTMLPGGFVMIWTGMRVLNDDGSVYHGVGTPPTVPVSPTPQGIAAGTDEVLVAAIARLNELLAPPQEPPPAAPPPASPDSPGGKQPD